MSEEERQRFAEIDSEKGERQKRTGQGDLDEKTSREELQKIVGFGRYGAIQLSHFEKSASTSVQKSHTAFARNLHGGESETCDSNVHNAHNCGTRLQPFLCRQPSEKIYAKRLKLGDASLDQHPAVNVNMSKFGVLVMGPAGAGKVSLSCPWNVLRCLIQSDHLLFSPHNSSSKQPSIMLLCEPRPRGRGIRARARP